MSTFPQKPTHAPVKAYFAALAQFESDTSGLDLLKVLEGVLPHVTDKPEVSFFRFRSSPDFPAFTFLNG